MLFIWVAVAFAVGAAGQNCSDSPSFRDKDRNDCSRYRRTTCMMMANETADVLKHCPATCKACPAATRCSDDSRFTDAFDYECDAYEDFSCHWTSAELDAVRTHCPASCQLCDPPTCLGASSRQCQQDWRFCKWGGGECHYRNSLTASLATGRAQPVGSSSSRGQGEGGDTQGSETVTIDETESQGKGKGSGHQDGQTTTILVVALGVVSVFLLLLVGLLVRCLRASRAKQLNQQQGIAGGQKLQVLPVNNQQQGISSNAADVVIGVPVEADASYKTTCKC